MSHVEYALRALLMLEKKTDGLTDRYITLSARRGQHKTKLHVTTAKECSACVSQGKDYLYKTQYSFFDLSVDENGLWAIYADNDERSSLLVSKLNADDLTIEKTWTVPVIHAEYGNGFIACGLLYLIKDVVSTTTTIDYAYDLYTKQRRNASLSFNNPYHMNTMVAFNHVERQIYSWDRGHLLTYPLLLEPLN